MDPVECGNRPAEGPQEGAQKRSPRDPKHIQSIPDVVWRDYIFPYLKEDTLDILNLARTCPQFEDLLQSEHVLAECQLEETIPLLLKWLNRNVILACRGVCKRITKAVDKVLDLGGIIIPHRNLNIFPRLVPPFKPAHVYERQHFSAIPAVRSPIHSSVETLEKLRMDFETRAVSTLVAKYFRIDVSVNDAQPPTLDPPILLDHLLELLNSQLFRENVRRFRLAVANEVLNVDQVILLYDLLRSYISALPKLKTLYFDTLAPFSELEDDQVTRFELHIAANPLPAVPLLEHVTIWDCVPSHPVFMSIFQEIAIRYGGQLKGLKLGFWERGSEEFEWEEEIQLPALLSLEMFEAPWQRLPLLFTMRAGQLQQLRLFNPFYDTPQPMCPVQLLIQTIQHFPSISDFVLESADFRRGRPADPSVALRELQYERHRNMRRLVLDGRWFGIQVEFFATFFPNLEFISIKSIAVEEMSERNDPDLDLASEGRFEESTLWNQLPHLEVFWYKDYCCTRAMAQEFHENDL